MIVEAIAADDFRVETLLPSSRSPHDYALRFSDRKRLLEADLVVWVGPTLEYQLQKLLAVGSNPLPSLQLDSISGLSWPAAEGEASAHHHGAHSHTERDPHIWLNPENAVLMARSIAKRLAAVAPLLEARLEANLKNFEDDVAKIVEISRKELETVQSYGFVVMHDGFRHWVDYFQLNQVAALHHGSGVDTGLKARAQLLALRGEVVCIFAEPQWPRSKVESVARQLNARTGVLDPVGRDIAPGESGYVRLLQGMTENLVSCLAYRQ